MARQHDVEKLLVEAAGRIGQFLDAECRRHIEIIRDRAVLEIEIDQAGVLHLAAGPAQDERRLDRQRRVAGAARRRKEGIAHRILVAVLDGGRAVQALAGAVDIDERAVLGQPVIHLDLHQPADDLLIQKAREGDDRRIGEAQLLEAFERRQIVRPGGFQIDEQNCPAAARR